MSLLLKFSAFLVALGGIVLVLIFWPQNGSEWDACDRLSGGSMAWLSCLETARAGKGSAQAIAIANGVGGLLSGLVLYAIGHIVGRIDALHSKLIAPSNPPVAFDEDQSVAFVQDKNRDAAEYFKGV